MAVRSWDARNGNRSRGRASNLAVRWPIRSWGARNDHSRAFVDPRPVVRWPLRPRDARIESRRTCTVRTRRPERDQRLVGLVLARGARERGSQRGHLALSAQERLAAVHRWRAPLGRPLDQRDLPTGNLSCRGLLLKGASYAASAGRIVKLPPWSGTTARKARSSKVRIRVVPWRAASITSDASARPSRRSR